MLTFSIVVGLVFGISDVILGAIIVNYKRK